MIALLMTLLKRECLLLMRKPSQVINPIIFFILIISLFPMGVAIESVVLQKTLPSLIWVATLLSALLMIDRLFLTDFESGILEQQLLSPISLYAIVYAKLFVLWLMMVIPLILALPLIGTMYGLPANIWGVAALSLVCGTPIIAIILGILAAVALGVSNRNGIMALILLPLTIPVLIFGSGSILMAMQALNYGAILTLMCGIAVLCITVGPFLIVKAIEINCE